MHTLRDYQQSAVAAVLQAVAGGDQRLLYCMATGLGKTIIFTQLTRVVPGDGPCIVLAHREELLSQAAAELKRAGPDLDIGIERAEHKAPEGCAVVVASVQTLGRANNTRLEWMKGRVRLIVCDEAHHAPAPSYRTIFERFGCFDPGGPLLVGCTATPKRLDRQNLHAIFQKQVFEYPIRRGIDDGWLSDVRGYRVEGEADLDSVSTSGGDLNQGELAAAVDVESRTAAVIDRWMDVAWDRPTVAFCVDIEHAKHVAQAWNDAGIRSAWIASKGMTMEERGVILQAWKRGEIQTICNVEILTEGFDHPPLSCIAMFRPTKSWSLYVQMVGRGTRGGWRCPVEGKDDLIVIDVVDNTSRHSLAAVPAILDLPADIDLQGESLSEAARDMDELGERLAGLKGIKPKTFKEIKLLLQEVDLFAAAVTPPEVARITSFAWLEVPGGLFLGCGSNREAEPDAKGRQPARSAHLGQDLLGEWRLALIEGDRTIHESEPLGELEFALGAARRIIESYWPGVGALADSGAKWRGDPPSEGQLRMLKKLGIKGELLTAIVSKGHASDLITQRLQAQSRR